MFSALLATHSLQKQTFIRQLFTPVFLLFSILSLVLSRSLLLSKLWLGRGWNYIWPLFAILSFFARTLHGQDVLDESQKHTFDVASIQGRSLIEFHFVFLQEIFEYLLIELSNFIANYFSRSFLFPHTATIVRSPRFYLNS